MTRNSFVAAAVAAMVASQPMVAAALDVQPADYAWVGDGRTLAIAYAQHQQSDTYFGDDGAEVADSKLRAQVLVLRAVHYREMAGEKFAFHAVLPIANFDHVSVGGNRLATNDGIGDLTLGATWFPQVSSDPMGTTWGVSAFVTAPTGEFDPNAQLNLPSGTWTLTPQVGMVQGLGNGFFLDAGAEANIYRDFDRAGVSYERDTSYQAQAYIRYQYSDATAFSLGYTAKTGGDLFADGNDTGVKTQFEQVRLLGSTFVTQSQQAQVMIGKDVSGKGGFAMEPLVEFRFVSVF